jgi:hypothetical protein
MDWASRYVKRDQLAEKQNLNRKEVRFMKYEKPVMTVLAPAIDAIQSSTAKRHPVVVESFQPHQLATIPAYEADE